MTTPQQQMSRIVRIAQPHMNRTHQSEYSDFLVTLTGGEQRTLTIPLAAAVAIEEAGFAIVLTGRLN